ncbi:MAG: InlB B-repeat-containing protein, partial [Bacilli bacterium]|nr:InlB B-repeat-containing protein [Bacilli bacterium]
MRKKSILLVSSALLASTLAGCGGQSSSAVTSGGGGLPVIGNAYVVTFNFNDGSSRPMKKEVAKGTSLEKGPTPVREGYDFMGWYTALEGGEQVTFPFAITADTSLYAHWDAAKLEATFYLNYEGAPEPTVVEVAYGQSVEPIDDPVRDKFVFRYWTLDPEGNLPAEFPYQMKKDVSFYASWRDEDTRVYTVTAHYGDYDGAPEDKVFTLEEGESLAKSSLPDPTRSGYDFKGWSLTEGGEAITFPLTPTEDTDLYAIWELKTYNLDFAYNYVDSPSTYFLRTTYHGGENFDAPETDPTRDGYTFAGWYTAEKGGTKVKFPTTGYRNLKYYAHWESVPVVTDILHAEYCAFDPNFDYPGYSGQAKGDQCVIKTSAPGTLVDNYPMNSARASGLAYVVSYQYSNSAVLRFEFEASEDITGAKLLINWSAEF